MPALVETVETSSLAMDYVHFGHGNEALVILPGLSVQSVAGAADAIAQAYAPLANDFTIYLFERPKHLPDPYPVRAMARDVRTAIQALNLERICLFGVSLGGMIAQELAVHHPDLVRKLVLGSTTPRVTGEQRRLLEQWVALAERGDARGLYLAFGEAVYPPDVFEQAREQFIEAAQTVTNEDLKRFAIIARGAEDFSLSGSLSEIACPVLAIGSSDDKVLGAEGTLRIAEQLGEKPNFELHMYDGYGHAAYDVAPDYKDRLLRFLTA